MDYILKSNKKKIVINDYIQDDPLSEENLSKTLKYINKIGLSCPNKTIWLYSCYEFDQVVNNHSKWLDFILENDESICNFSEEDYRLWQRYVILQNVDIMVDGRYIDSQRNPKLKFRGSENQRAIDVQKSLKQNKVVLWCD